MPRWAICCLVLVGDALHFKDPVDGQGIYDALLEARLLADALVTWRSGGDWDQTMTTYDQAVRAATHVMFLATTTRLKRELYGEPPVFVIRTLVRWMMTDPRYQAAFLRFLNRDVSPAKWLTAGLASGCIVRGIGRDVARWFR